MDFTSFFDREGRGKKLYVVVHVEAIEQALRNVRIAHNAGSDGVFLIDHNNNANYLMMIYEVVRAEFPDWFIGLNFLDLSTTDAFTLVRRIQNVSALWHDDSGIYNITENLAVTAEHMRLQKTMKASLWNGYYFPSAAFKGQEETTDLFGAARFARVLGHVTVTSGKATGSAPDVAKIAAMKAAAPDHPLAIARGVDASNIREFLPHADIFMVNTGISDSFSELNPERVEILAALIHTY